MTYKELLIKTDEKKKKALSDISTALKGPCGFLIKSEIERNPGKYAWIVLAREFCEELSKHINDFYNEDEYTLREVEQIYMAYQDGDEDIYYYLPVEAQLFD